MKARIWFQWALTSFYRGSKIIFSVISFLCTLLQFTGEIANKLGSKHSRTLVIVADGVLGLSASQLGLSDEFILHSCPAFGAVCDLERLDVPQLPTPETLVNRVKLDLSAFGSEYRLPELSQATFDLKIYGTFRHRYLALTCQKCESNLLRQLRITTDETVSDVFGVLKDSLVIIVIQFCVRPGKISHGAILRRTSTWKLYESRYVT